MQLRALEMFFSVCKVNDLSAVDLSQPYVFAAVTDEEKSLVCPTDRLTCPVIAREDGWKAFRIEGVLDFSLVGILARIASVLADNGIPVFAVSTYNTDYLFIKHERFEDALGFLQTAGYEVLNASKNSAL